MYVLIFIQALRSTDSQCSADEEPTEGLPNLGTTSPVSSSYSELRQVIKLAILIFFFIIENLITMNNIIRELGRLGTNILELSSHSNVLGWYN